MTDNAPAVAVPRQMVIRPQVGLMLSIGEPPDGGRNYPKKLSYFRPKPGSEGQYAEAVHKFEEAYPTEESRKRIEISFISNALTNVLDIRLKAWGTSGLRAIGQTNLALCPERLLAYDDMLTAFPEDRPDAIEYQLKGPDDPIIDRVGLKLYGVLRFAIPPVTGLTTLAEISTTSKRTMGNWLAGITQAQTLAAGQLAGIPFVLAVRPARTRFFDAKKGKRSTSTFYEVVLEAQHSIDEFMELVQTRREQMQLGNVPRLELPAVRHDDAERDRELTSALWPNGESGESAAERLQHAEPDLDERPQVREEAAPDRPDDARLNRLAQLERQVGTEATLAVLRGVFGVDNPLELDDQDAERLEQMLLRNVAAAEEAEPAEHVVGEVVEESDAGDGSVFERMASEAQERGRGGQA